MDGRACQRNNETVCSRRLKIVPFIYIVVFSALNNADLKESWVESGLPSHRVVLRLPWILREETFCRHINVYLRYDTVLSTSQESVIFLIFMDIISVYLPLIWNKSFLYSILIAVELFLPPVMNIPIPMPSIFRQDNIKGALTSRTPTRYKDEMFYNICKATGNREFHQLKGPSGHRPSHWLFMTVYSTPPCNYISCVCRDERPCRNVGKTTRERNVSYKYLICMVG